MKIAVMNGSPKAKQSITLHHIHYMMKAVPEHEIDIINVANRIAKIEKDQALFDDIISRMAQSDAVIWSFPVYYALIPSQLKRFFELIFERCPVGSFDGKYATSFTTSINFFDHTAHNYIQGVCEALGFRYVRSYSAHMNDFFHADKRDGMIAFYRWFIRMVGQNVVVNRKYAIHCADAIVYEPGRIEARDSTVSQKVLLLTDQEKTDTNLANMVDVFQKVSPMPVTIKNIHDIDMKKRLYRLLHLRL